MNNLSDFDKVVILNALCSQFPGCIIRFVFSKNPGVLMYGIEMYSGRPEVSFYAPLGAGFSGFKKYGNRYTALLHFYDLNLYCEHYSITLGNNEPAAN